MTLPTRRIGPFTVSLIGLGCMNLSHGYEPLPDAAQAERILHRALDLGCTFLDTAAIYGDGANERLIDRSVMRRRTEFTLTSKCVLDVIDGERALDGSPAAIARTLDAALGRLGTDHVDLYYLHRLDPRVPIEESVGALARAVEAGKIVAIGLSEMGAATIRRAHAVHPVTAVQSEYSPAVRNPEVAVLETCRELGIGFVAFSPVARGLLAAGVRDAEHAAADLRRVLPRYVEPNLSANLPLIERFDALAAEAGLTPARLSLGWVLAKGEDIVPIPGTTNLAHLEDDLRARPLDTALTARVDALFPPNALVGARYSAALQASIDTELLPDEPLAA